MKEIQDDDFRVIGQRDGTPNPGSRKGLRKWLPWAAAALALAVVVCLICFSGHGTVIVSKIEFGGKDTTFFANCPIICHLFIKIFSRPKQGAVGQCQSRSTCRWHNRRARLRCLAPPSYSFSNRLTVSMMFRVATSFRMASSREIPSGLMHSRRAKPAFNNSSLSPIRPAIRQTGVSPECRRIPIGNNYSHFFGLQNFQKQKNNRITK